MIPKLIRYTGVSAVATLVSLVVLGALAAEALSFAAPSLAGLGLSTITVHAAAVWASSLTLAPALRATVAEAAHMAAFGALWIVQFVLLDRVLFGTRDESQEPLSPLPETRSKVPA